MTEDKSLPTKEENEKALRHARKEAFLNKVRECDGEPYPRQRVPSGLPRVFRNEQRPRRDTQDKRDPRDFEQK